MRVMLLVKATEDSEKGFPHTSEETEVMEAMRRFNDELRKAGIPVTADGLKPSSYGQAYCVRWRRPYSYRRAFRRASRTDRRLLALGSQGHGPGGRLVKRCPKPMPGRSEIEIWPLYEMADLR
jgi:hypothetical protein